MGYAGVDADNPGLEVIHRGKHKTLTAVQRRWLERRQAIEPMIGHTERDHRMARCWLKGAVGDALHAISCAAGYNIRWLMRAILAALSKPTLYGLNSAMAALIALRDVPSLIRIAARASLGLPLAALPAGALDVTGMVALAGRACLHPVDLDQLGEAEDARAAAIGRRLSQQMHSSQYGTALDP